MLWDDEEGVVHVTKPNVMCLPDRLYEHHRPLQKSILSLENRLPVGVFELSELSGKQITRKEITQRMAKSPNNQEPVYTTRLQKGGALIKDMRVFVRGRCDEGDDGASDNEHLPQNVLGKITRVRAKDVYRRAFLPRFVNGDPQDAWKLIRPLEDREVASEVLTPLYYWMTARAEPILYDFAADFVLDRSKSHDPGIRVDETTQWISGRLKERKQAWSVTVRLKMARGMLAALRDFGILEGRIKKTVAPVYLPVESFAYLAFLLHILGSDGAGLVNHPDWRLYLLTPKAVERMFLDADQNHLLKFEAAGRVYRIEFPAETPEEMADVISKR